MNLTYKNSLWMILALALTAIGTALYYEYALNYQPCALCYEERIPYYILIAVSVLALVADRFMDGKIIGKMLIGALGILMFLGSLYGVYHAGIEWDFWAGPSTCTGAALSFDGSTDLLSLVTSIKIVPCDVANWRLFGISFAGYNALTAMLMAVICGLALNKNR
ncbi:MAG: disulfide bond formation protein B [Rhizobiales bacterium]|nr:disulfide bond formation protein B [Hyphomicrobiales bacterium]NRB15667.1 disulfide bond formation protein B [Hyphomicrobiales bacterium]